MKRLTISGHACTETLALLIAIAWADGNMDENEKAGVRGASEVLNLTKELRARLETLMQEPLPLDQLLIDTLSPREGAFAFVAATWLTGVDEHVDPKEKAVLEQVATMLGLSKERQEELTAIGREVHPVDRANKNWAHEIVTLFKAIAPRLEATPGDAEVSFE